MTQVLQLLALPEAQRIQYLERTRAAFPDLIVDSVDHYSKVEPYIETADVLMTFGPMMSDSVLRAASRLRWVQAMGSGVDGIVNLPSLRPEVLITNMHGIHSGAMVEAGISAMLALARQTPRIFRNQVSHLWERFPAATLKGATAAIVGVGAIATALAPVCKALGMRVIGVSSTPRDVPGFDSVVARSEVIPAVSEADFVILLVPSSTDTQHLVDARFLAAMKPTAFVVNLARGAVIDDTAMLAALRSGAIAGAALDVFQQEPLPLEHPYWDLPNVIVTPHLGGFFDGYVDLSMPLVEANMRSFLAGDITRMRNIVRHP